MDGAQDGFLPRANNMSCLMYFGSSSITYWKGELGPVNGITRLLRCKTHIHHVNGDEINLVTEGMDARSWRVL